MSLSRPYAKSVERPRPRRALQAALSCEGAVDQAADLFKRAVGGRGAEPVHATADALVSTRGMDTTATSQVHALDAFDTAAMPALAEGDATDAFPTFSAAEASTLEQPVFEEPMPLPAPLTGEPIYLVEVRPPHGEPSLLAARTTLDDAMHIAEGVHPSVADVTIRELPLPCDAASLARAIASLRSWSRDPSGTWTPDLAS